MYSVFWTRKSKITDEFSSQKAVTMTPCAFDRKGLLHEVLEQFKVTKRGVHGQSHWARVGHHALTVGQATGADLLVVELFAFLHDSKRVNEDRDPDHRFRAASFAAQLNGRYFKLDGSQLDVLCYAMTHHSNGAVDADPTAQTCWGADRLDLGRAGIKSAARYLSPAAAQRIESAYAWGRQPKGLVGDELGLELSPQGQNKQAREHTQGNVL
jgi:uncharacterized protein